MSGAFMDKAKITIIGAGIIGLSVASRLAGRYRDLFVIERHESFGRETSSRNSEVIHASIYYPHNSLKGSLCLEGNELMYRICRENDIPHRNTGKLIVAVDDEEEAALPGLLGTARDNGARGVEIVSGSEIQRMEPSVAARAAVYCPSSGIVDTHSLMQHYEAVATGNGANIVFNTEVKTIEKVPGGYQVGIENTDGSSYRFQTETLINCAGLASGHVSELAGIDIDEAGYRINYLKGIYFRVHGSVSQFPRALIYPVPPAPGSVGIHTVPDLGGGMRLGPYDYWVDSIDYSVTDEHRELVYNAVERFLPFLDLASIQPDSSGIHPKIQKPGESMKDFVIRHEDDRGLENFINLVGIESPGVTASPAIGRYVADIVEEIYGV